MVNPEGGERPFKHFNLDVSQQWRLVGGVKYAEMHGETSVLRSLVENLRSIQEILHKELDRQTDDGKISPAVYRAYSRLGDLIVGIDSQHSERTKMLQNMGPMFKGRNPGGFGREPFGSDSFGANLVIKKIIEGDPVDPKLP